MLRTNRNNLLALFCWTIVFVYPASILGQSPLENTLLWEIVHPNRQQTSYLFATVHRNDSLVLQVDATLLGRMKRCDVLALESDPARWQTNLSQDPMVAFGWPTAQGRMLSHLHPASFQLPEYRSAILQALTQAPAQAIAWMRYSPGRATPMLDILLFQTAFRLQKPVVELETETALQNVFEPERMPSPSEQLITEERTPRGLSQPWDESYLQGHLRGFAQHDALYGSPADQQILQKRNRQFVQQITRLLQKQTAFIAVGAAHITGKHGLLNQLIQAGFDVKPLPFQRQISLADAIGTIKMAPTADSNYRYNGEQFELRSPARLYRANGSTLYPLNEYTDIARGHIYVAGRVATAAALRGYTPEQVLQHIKTDVQQQPNVQLVYAADTMVGKLIGWRIIMRDRYGMWQERLLLVDQQCCWIVGWHGPEIDRQYAQGVCANFRAWQPTEELRHWALFESIDTYGDAQITHEHTVDAQGNSIWHIEHTLPQLDRLDSDSLQLELAERGWRRGGDIASAGTAVFGEYFHHLVLENTYRTKTGLRWRVRFLRTGPTIHTWIYSNADSIDFAYLGFPAQVELSENALRESTDSTVGFRMRLAGPVTTPALDRDAKQKRASGGAIFRRFWLGKDKQIQLEVIPLSTYQQWPDSSAFFQQAVQQLQSVGSHQIQVIESKPFPKKHQWKIRLLLTDTGSNNATRFTIWLSGKYIYRLSTNYDMFLLRQNQALWSAFNSFEPLAPTAAATSVIQPAHYSFWNDFLGRNKQRSAGAQQALPQMRFFPGDLPFLNRAWNQLRQTNSAESDLEILIHQTALIGKSERKTVPMLAAWHGQIKSNNRLRSAVLLALARMANAASSALLWKLDSSLYPSLHGTFAQLDWESYLPLGIPHRARYIAQIKQNLLTTGGSNASWNLLYQLHHANLLTKTDYTTLESVIMYRLDSSWKKLPLRWKSNQETAIKINRSLLQQKLPDLIALLARCPNGKTLFSTWTTSIPAPSVWWAQVYFWSAQWREHKQIDSVAWNTLQTYLPGRLVLEEQTALSQGKAFATKNDSVLRERGKGFIYATKYPKINAEVTWLKDTLIATQAGQEQWHIYQAYGAVSNDTLLVLAKSLENKIDWLEEQIYTVPYDLLHQPASWEYTWDSITIKRRPYLRNYIDSEAYRASIRAH